MSLFAPVVPSTDYLYFQGHAFPPPKNQRSFSVLCGDDPPTVTDGYAIWNTIARPLLQGVTVPAGFNPAQMKINVRFGVWDGRYGHRGWDTSDDAGQAIEQQIDDLHWMAGGNQLAGASPVVYVDAFRNQNGRKVRTYLVPRQYWGVAWVINGGIEWGKSLRDPQQGRRIYQEAAFTLLGFLGVGLNAPRETSGRSGGFFKTSQHIRTILAIAGAPSADTPEALLTSLANKIKTAHQNNPCRGSKVKLERKSLTAPLPVGLTVWVPGH